tara:strand:- start:14522 stop:14779 length:258 start_codon:yes stop_codon:yes gene_type:complete
VGCEKKTFESKELASIRLEEIKIEGGKEKTPLRVYKCDKCEKFHLTSITRDTQKKINKRREGIKNKPFKDFLNRETEYWENKFKD